MRLTVFDVLGRHIAQLYDGERAAGAFVTTWDGRDSSGAPVPAGLYLLRLDDGRSTRTRTVVVVR
jgi:flagellar basal-body rod modification protein FlgD